MKRAILLAALAALLIAGCSSKEPAPAARYVGPGGQGDEPPPAPKGQVTLAPGEQEISLAPEETTIDGGIRLTAKRFELGDAHVVWLVNGAPVSTHEIDEFSPRDDGAKKGDEVMVKVTYRELVFNSNAVAIKNSLPLLNYIKLVPDKFKTGDKIGVDARAEDADGDEVTVKIEWFKNGKPEGSGQFFEGELKRGDKIEAKVVPNDGQDDGKYFMVIREIKNFPPTVDAHKNYKFDDRKSLFTYQTKAQDNDEDTLTYTLKLAPAGMTIDSETGLVTWNVPKDFEGQASFSVAVEDGNGGTSQGNVDFTIGFIEEGQENTATNKTAPPEPKPAEEVVK